MNKDSTIFNTHYILAKYFSKKYAICTNSYNSTIISALLTLNLENKFILVNSEYIANILINLNYRPILVNTINFHVDLNDLVNKIKKYKSYCLILTHNNKLINLDKILHYCIKHNVYIIDDFRKKYSKSIRIIGELSCFSLEEGSFIHAEEGGFIVTDIERFNNKLLSLVGYTNNSKVYNYSYRITKMQCKFIKNLLDK
jgi:dTDP-4-amino-4,6-dideoxygalactose transaminase